MSAHAESAQTRSDSESERTVHTRRIWQPATFPPPAFDLVRRGYNREQVDDRITKLFADRDSILDHIAHLEERMTTIASLAGGSTHQTMGAGQRKAEEIIADVHIKAEREFTARTSSGGKSAALSPFKFDFVRRGYEPAQVDDWMVKFVADCDRGLKVIADLENRIRELESQPI